KLKQSLVARRRILNGDDALTRVGEDRLAVRSEKDAIGFLLNVPRSDLFASWDLPMRDTIPALALEFPIKGVECLAVNRKDRGRRAARVGQAQRRDPFGIERQFVDANFRGNTAGRRQSCAIA